MKSPFFVKLIFACSRLTLASDIITSQSCDLPNITPLLTGGMMTCRSLINGDDVIDSITKYEKPLGISYSRRSIVVPSWVQVKGRKALHSSHLKIFHT